ncbi:replicative protein [Rudphi virus 5]|uniref:replicative protein n=1 Tax=Rudphi virus 5 TaxID=2480188 RepID=UPI000F0CEC5F|nr:replicative protein [Rudphi virus 5]AYN75571.1 replicative protein [Rudphi virus 5]
MSGAINNTGATGQTSCPETPVRSLAAMNCSEGSLSTSRICRDFNALFGREVISQPICDSSLGIESRDVHLTKKYTSIRTSTDTSLPIEEKSDIYKKNEVEEFIPQFGLESISAATFTLDSLAKFAGVDVPDKIVREVEGIALLMINLSQQTTALGVTTSILTWAQGRVTKSLFKTLKDFIEELFFQPQSSTSATPAWLDCLRDTHQNWSLCKSNRAFKQISVLLGCLVTLGLCDATKLTFSLGQFQVFAPILSEKHLTCFDVVDAMFETVVFFTEGAYLCFKTKSLKPLLMNDRTAMELDTEYANVITWFELVRNGNLSKFTELSDQEFEKRLNRLSTSLLNLSQSLRGPEKKLVMERYTRILSIQNDYVSMKVASGVRHAPWAIELFGASSQGKTTLGDQLVDAVLTSQGLPVSKEYRCAYNAGDKFMSNWTSDKLVMIFDDVSNDKSQFVEQPPTRAIIDVINNQMYYAPKAELHAKGKCFVEPWICMATTNKKNLDAGLYSNCPYSIQRRLTCLTVNAKPEFQRQEGKVCCGIDSKKVREHYTTDGVYTPPMFDDIWTVTIENAIQPADLKTVADYQPIVWRGQKMINISMATCIQWAIESFNDHKLNQEALLEGMRLRTNKMELCRHPNCIQLHGNCPDHPVVPICKEVAPLEVHFGKETVAKSWKLWYNSKKKRDDIEEFWEDLDKKVAKKLYKSGNKFLNDFDWITVIPSSYFNHERTELVYKFFKDEEIIGEARRRVFNSFLGCFVITAIAFCFLGILATPIFFYLAFKAVRLTSNVVKVVEKELFERLKKRNMDIAPIVAEYRDKYAKEICYSAIGLAALYALARAYRAYCKETPQGSLEPKTPEEIIQRDSETSVWTKVVQRVLPISENSQRMSTTQLDNVVQKALVYGSIHTEGENGMVNGLMLSSNVMLVPEHYFEELGDELNCTFRKKNPEASGGKFIARLSKFASHLIPNTDMRVCYVPNGGSFKNLVDFFPTEEMPSTPFRMHWRKKNGEIITAKGLTHPGIVKTNKSFKGGMYKNLTMNTFAGLCGATLVSDTNGCSILGIHLGGTADTPRGCYGSVTQQQLFDAFAALRKVEGVILSGEAGEFKTKVMGVQFLKTEPVHPKSPLNYMPENSQVQYHGSCIGRTVTKTRVINTPISPHIATVCDVPNIYHGPELNPDWKGWQECLASMSTPSTPFPHALLARAVKDYKEPLLEIFKSDLWNNLRPLTDHENLCGVPGKKFLDPIKLNTSVGYPLSGPKREFVTELPPEKGKPNNRRLDNIITDEIDRIEALYRKGERAYPIAKACKKDEILSKKKCRIFYGNSLPLTFLIRKYFLPILRVCQMNPLVSECAVGINCHGPEWEEFHKHVLKFGIEMIAGGDYGKFDQKLCAQLIFASLRILIDLARTQLGYTEEDLNIMEAMTADIVFACIAFNGDLISLTEGSHISGNSLTVTNNSICGSLNQRCCFFSMYPGTKLTFRDVVALMTYGDDAIGSVRKGFEKFNIKSMSEFLAKYGQIYTMPDKTSELQDYLPYEQFEFLKRKSVYHPKLGVHVGALLDASIYKSLHCMLREKNCVNTIETACAENIDGALREWFNHGEEKYEDQRQKMTKVANLAGISHMCTSLNTCYNERAAAWVAQYKPETPAQL